MKGFNVLKALALGSAMALGNALSGASGLRVASPQVQTASTGGKGKGQAGNKPRSYWYKPVRTSSRNPRGDLAAAIAKRERRAIKRIGDLTRSTCNNLAHAFTGNRLNPFYINRSNAQ